MRYYVHESGLKFYRTDGGRCQAYSFPLGAWVDDTEIMDLFIGELWADEVSEEEANDAIARRNREIHIRGGSRGTGR